MEAGDSLGTLRQVIMSTFLPPAPGPKVGDGAKDDEEEDAVGDGDDDSQGDVGLEFERRDLEMLLLRGDDGW